MRRRLLMRRTGARALDYPSAEAAVAGPLLDMTLGGTFTRASSATYLTGTGTIGLAAIDVRRMEDRGEGEGALLLLEGAHTNLLSNSSAINSWTAGSGVTITANDVAAPDGTTTADRMAMSGTTSFSNFQTIAVAAGKYTASLWAKAYDAGNIGKTFRFGGKSSTTVIYKVTSTLAATWTRYQDSRNTSGGATNTFPVYDNRANEPEGGGVDAALPAYTAHVWGHQLEARGFASSLVHTTTSSATAAADVLEFSTGYSATLLSGRWRVEKVCPRFSSANMASGDTYVLFSFGGANDVIQIRHNGTAVIVEVKQGGAVKVASSAITFSQHQPLDLTFDSAAGEITVAGATTGNGTTTATSWTMTNATLRVGAVQGTGASPFFGRYSNAIPA
jgi:hypothetical protein